MVPDGGLPGSVSTSKALRRRTALEYEPGSLWQTALRQLAQSVSPANYETWLSDTEGVRWDGGIERVS